MQILPALPRERVAVGVALATLGVVIGFVANDPVRAYGSGGLVGLGVALTAINLLRLRQQARRRSTPGG